MPWYAAHIILYTKFSDGIQDTYPVWENVLMINAPTSNEAFDRAERKGHFEASGSEGYTYGGRPATWVFAGIRKLNQCIEDFNPEEQASDGMEVDGMEVDGVEVDGVEVDGVEVTYSSFVLDSASALQHLVGGKSVSLVYEGREDEGHEDEGESNSEAA